MDALQARFRKVEIQCSGAIEAPRDTPETWAQFEVQGRTVSFMDTLFESNAALRQQLDGIFPGVQRMQVTALSLREIFISLAPLLQARGAARVG